ncbi:MAG TPA: BrnT family toxin [Geobacteraceae bacterium]
MKYEWDEAKRKTNQEKHGVDFAEVEGFDWETAFVIPDTRADYGELRYRAMGFVGKRLYALVFTPRSGTVRLVSLRKANPREAKCYEANQESD